MKAFTALYSALDETNRTNAKIAAMADYFTRAPAASAAWAVWFLSGGRPKRLVGWRKLRDWAVEASQVPDWLFDECYQAVGDLAETIALLLPESGRSSERSLAHWVEERLLPLQGADEEVQRREMLDAWRRLDSRQAFVWNKLITGGMRVGVSQRLVLRALSRASGIDAAALAHRLMGNWQPSADAYRSLLAEDTGDTLDSRPYPFFLAHPLTEEPGQLGPPDEWQAEWKWDGIRAQLIARRGGVYLWSRGEELVTDSFPEPAAAARLLPEGTVLDGELVAWRHGRVRPFADLQRRLGRKQPGPRILERVPVTLLAFDLLEDGGEDLRPRPLTWRRRRLEEILQALPDGTPIRLSPRIEAGGWEELARLQAGAREQPAEGLMLKRLDSPYGVGRKRGDWWKWKVDPYSVDAVLIYAQRGHGRRASLYTDYTFGVWDGDALVPFAKAYSGLTNQEIRQVDRFVRRNTRERFGPVRSVEPKLVFELHFEGIQPSKRHKSGIAVRFPRMARWRHDKKPEEADTLETVKELLPQD